jgi:hypothetical protein
MVCVLGAVQGEEVVRSRRTSTTPAAVDWAAVELACFRSKNGTPVSLADFDLCKAAHEADPEKYAEISGKGHRRAMALVNPLLRTEDDG